MRFSVEQMETFYWLASLKNFRLVGEKLSISQPTVSLRIKELERQAGAPLLMRNGSVVELTARGQLLCIYAEELMRVKRGIEYSFSSARKISGVIRVGSPDSYAKLFLFPFLKELGGRYPDIDVHLTIEYSHILYEKLMQEELDFAFLSVRSASAAVVLVPLCDLELRWAASAQGQMAARRTQPEELLRQMIVTTPPVSNLYQYMIDWFEGICPAHLSICNSLPTIIDMIGSGFGIGIVPTCLVPYSAAAPRIAYVDTSPMPNDRLFLAFRETRRAALLSEAFVEIAGRGIEGSAAAGVITL